MIKDPHVHVEKTPMPSFGQGQMRDLIASATGLVGDLPKTVGTGCGRRRRLSQTSNNPEKVTCLACREWAVAEYTRWAEFATTAIALTPDPEKKELFRKQADEYTRMAKELSS